MGAGISIIGIVSSLDNCDIGCDPGKTFLNFTKKLTCVALIVDVLAMVVPTKDEIIAMYVAGYITPANIETVGEFTGKTVDALIEKILKASKAIKE